MAPAAALLSAVLVLMNPLPGAPAPHGEGVLRADRGSAAMGESLNLDGSKFEPDEAYEIKLVGALQEFLLTTVRTDSAGAFALTVSLPREAKAGSYRLQAVAEDGDVSAALDITLLASAPIPNERSTEPMADMPGMTGPMATAEEIPINRDQSGVVWAIMGGFIGLAAGLGLGLLSRKNLEYTGA